MNEYDREGLQAHLEQLEIEQDIIPFPGAMTIKVSEADLRDQKSTEVFEAWLAGKIDTDSYFKFVQTIHDPEGE